MSNDLKFSVGYYLGSCKICFSESDDIKDLVKLRDNGRQLHEILIL